MNIRNFFATLSFAGVISLILFETFSNFYKKPPLYAVVRAQGFKTLLEIKKDPFNKGKRTFVTNKEDLFRENFIPYLTNKASDAEGAYYLSKWCGDEFNSTDGDSLTLGRARKYCTATGAIEFLEEDKVKLIEGLDSKSIKQEGQKVFKELKGNVVRAGIIKGFNDEEKSMDRNIELLKDWCIYSLNQNFNKEKHLDKKYARSGCVTIDTPKRN